MPEIKKHLKDLIRVSNELCSRVKLLRLDMNESVSGLPAAFVKEVFSSVNPDFLATYPEYNAITRKLADYNGIKRENICLANGSDAAIKYVFDAYIRRGDKVLLTDPTFAMYPVYCRMFDAKCIFANYKKDFKFPFEDFYGKLTKKVKMAVIVNPNNPTGSVIDKTDMDKILKKSLANNILLLIDEAYFYYYKRTFIKQIKNYDNLIVLRTFSKLCGIAAARFGYASADKTIIEGLQKVKPTYDINGFSTLLAERIISKKGLIKNLIGNAKKGKAYLCHELKKKKIDYIEGNANFILIKCGKKVDNIIRKLLNKGIIVHGGFSQGFLKDYLRVTVGNKEDMTKFCGIFLKIMGKR